MKVFDNVLLLIGRKGREPINRRLFIDFYECPVILTACLARLTHYSCWKLSIWCGTWS